MEDLRITGYNALLTPAFLQEEFPPVSSFCVHIKKDHEI
jgi:3-deoxy-7-phosphoheptulonate synthase